MSYNRFKPELTTTVLAKEYADWRRNEKTQLRFGQTIVNKYLKDDERAPDLFYETDVNFVLCSIIEEVEE